MEQIQVSCVGFVVKMQCISVFFATIYNKYVIRSSYFISGFGAGNKMIDLYVILAMPFNSFLVVVIYIIEIPIFFFGNAT